MSRTPPTQVVKFGGAALEWPRAVLAGVRARERAGPVAVIVSARAGVTDALESHLGAPVEASSDAELLDRLRRRHPGGGSAVRTELHALRALLEARQRSDATSVESIRASGERLAVAWIAARARAEGIAGLPLVADRIPLHVRPSGTSFTLDWVRDRVRLRAQLRRCADRGEVPWVTGYYGLDAGGSVRTLGRGGSDLTAVSVAAALGERTVELVKRDRAVCEADPVRYRAARAVPSLDYPTALALAQAPARVLHAPAVELAARCGIEVRISSLAKPREVTRIHADHTGPAGPILVEVPLGSGASREVPEGTGPLSPARRFLLVGTPDRVRSGLRFAPPHARVKFSSRSLRTAELVVPAGDVAGFLRRALRRRAGVALGDRRGDSL